MSLPILTTCDLFTKNKTQTNLVVHCLDELLVNDIFIPKKPHRHTFYQLLYIKEGRGVHKIDFNDYPITNKSLFFLSPGQVHNLELSKDSKGVLVNFDESLFHTFLVNPDSIDQYPFFWQNGKNSHYKLKDEDTRIIDVLQRISSTKNKSSELTRLYLLELFYLVNQNHNKNLEKQEFSSAQKLINHFEELIEQNYDLAHYPKFYAQKLAVTPNYLNAVCQKIKSKTAGDLIRDRIVLETKRLLVNSQLSVSEISYLLGFDDNSYFSKFFKQHESVTPTQFRKLL